MDTITFKVDKDMAKAMDKIMKPLYATKTEFIREAIRNHIKELEAENIMKQMKAFQRIPEKRTTLKELREIRKEVSKDLLKELHMTNMPKR